MMKVKRLKPKKHNITFILTCGVLIAFRGAYQTSLVELFCENHNTTISVIKNVS